MGDQPPLPLREALGRAGPGRPPRPGLRLAFRLAALGLLAPLALSGCWFARFGRMPNYAEETRADVIDLNARNEELLKRLESMERKIEDQTEVLRAFRAESASEIGILQERIQVLEERLRSGAPRGGGGSSGASSGAPSGSARGDTARAAADGAGDSRALYDAAYLELLKGNHDLAIVSFSDYLKRFPDADLADNAQYWIGECYLARGEAARAIEAFGEVGTRWPKGDKAPGALLKIASSFQGEGDEAAARHTYQDLIARYPNSDEARLARDRLALLSERD